MRSLLIGLGVEPVAADSVAADVASRYAEPHRRYHTGEHITEVLAEVDRLVDCVTLGADGATAVRLAAWFHDVIYDPGIGAGRSEDASAELAIRSLSAAGVGRPLVAEVARLVRLTAEHDVDASDCPGALLVDADLSILAAGAERYDRYVRDVRAEYGDMDEAAWRTGRASVLRSFLDAEAIYRVGPDRTHREQVARANLERELTSLTAAGSPPGGVGLAGAAVQPGEGDGPTREG